LFHVPSAVRHDDEQVHIAIRRGATVGIGAEQHHFLRAKLLRYPPDKTSNVFPQNHEDILEKVRTQDTRDRSLEEAQNGIVLDG